MEICPPEKLTNVSHFISRGLFCNYQKDVAARRAATSMFWFKENQRPVPLNHILRLPRLMHSRSRRREHLVVGRVGLQPVVNLLRHAVVVLAMASDKVERAFVSLAK